MKKHSDNASTIHYLREIFRRHELPKVLASDSVSIFKLKEYTNFYYRNGIRQILIASGYPATISHAERYFQTLKTKFKCMRLQSGTLQEKLCELLFPYGATPLSYRKILAKLILVRNLRKKLDLLIRKMRGIFKNISLLQPYCGKFFRVGT